MDLHSEHVFLKSSSHAPIIHSSSAQRLRLHLRLRSGLPSHRASASYLLVFPYSVCSFFLPRFCLHPRLTPNERAGQHGAEHELHHGLTHAACAFFRALFLLNLPLRPQSSFPCAKLDDVWHPRPSNPPSLGPRLSPFRLHSHLVCACPPTCLRFVPPSLHFVLAPRFCVCVYVCARSHSFPLPSSMLSLHPLALSSSYTFSVSSNAPPHLRPSLPIPRICLPSRLRRSLAFSLSFSPQFCSSIPSHLHSPVLSAFLFPSIHLYSPPLPSAASLSSLPSQFSVNNPRVECAMTQC
ncbi:hypothetical protein B0H13DRAFT_2423546 [Mycena leptocephala]|nr:hypothetical protein B0H13DRAFT_2423546 [Mycena leptocephala]